MWPRQAVDGIDPDGLAEDIGAGDVTTGAALRGDEKGLARATAKAELVVAGIAVFGEVFRTLDPTLTFMPRKAGRREGGQGAGISLPRSPAASPRF